MGESICVHGLGYIGLPTAAVLAQQGYDVSGYDTDPEVRAMLETRSFDFRELGLGSLVEDSLDSTALSVVDTVESADFHLVCVPTPLSAENHPNLDYVDAAMREIGSVLRPDDIVIIESTVPPRTTTTRARRRLEQETDNLVAGTDFGLVYSPETVMPGNVLSELRENDRIVGAIDPTFCERAMALYGSFSEGDIYPTDPTSAEFVKLIQNAYRDLNIAFANEISKIARDYGVESREVIELANRHPRVDILSPGPGVGGHCLPIDPWFLTTGSEHTALVETARQVNDGMSEFVATLVESALDQLPGRTVAILGVAYKGDVPDPRNSPGLALASVLDDAVGNGPSVVLSDPYVTMRDTEILDLEVALRGADAAVIVCDHSEYTTLDPERVAALMDGNVVLDTRGVLDPDRWTDFDLYTL